MVEMYQCQLSRPAMVQLDVGDSANLVMTRYGHRRDRQVSVRPWRVERNEPVDRTRQQHFGIFVDQVGPMTMARNKVKIAFLQQVILDAAHHQRGITLTDLWNHDANREAALRAQRTR